MSKLKLTMTSLLLALALVLSLGVASPATVSPALQATADTEDDGAADQIPAITPLAGFALPALDAASMTEVRIPVVIENVTAAVLPADLSALGQLHFAIRDGMGISHPLDTAHPRRSILPNHSLRYLDPAMAARWTLGFRLPTAVATDLALELVHGETTVRSWPVADLGTAGPATNAAAMADLTVAVGQRFEWEPGLTVTAQGLGSLLCGDPAIEAVTQVVAVTFDVSNQGAFEVRWPGYIHRDGTSVAQWADGTAADMSMETYVGSAETLPRVSTSAVRIPPMTASTRALVFATPRDGRVSDPTSLPTGVMLNAPSRHVWLSLAGADATVPLSPIFCDLGFFGGPVPFGYTPGAKFDVGGEAAPLDTSALDMAARTSITEALAGAALFYDANGQSFAGVTGNALVARTPRLSFATHEVGDALEGVIGVIYFAQRPDDDQFLYVATRSATGRWFCAGVVPHQSVVAADAVELEEITAACFPQSDVGEG